MTKKIKYEGIYWWSDSENVLSVLREYTEKGFSCMRPGTIEIRGTDFQDTRSNRYFNITVCESSNEIIIESSEDFE